MSTDSFGPGFRFDSREEKLSRDGTAIPLRSKSARVLAALIQSRGRPLAHEEIIAEVWRGAAVSDTVLRVCIREIRRALDDSADSPRFVASIPGGYRWIAVMDAPGGPAVGSTDLVVGRERELGELHDRLGAAVAGERQLVFVTGEGGIGKTALVDAFLAEVATGKGIASEGGIWVARGQCIDHAGPGEPYLPILSALADLCRGPGGKRFVDVLRRHAPTWLLQMPGLLGPGDAELRRVTAGGSTERMLRELAEALEAITGERERTGLRTASPPALVLVLEDLHWSDAATIDFLSFQARRREPARLLILATYRPVEVVVRAHPLGPAKRELQVHRLCRELALPPLGEEALAEYLTARFGEGAPRSRGPSLARLSRPLLRSTEGNPLFVVNVVDDLIGRGMIRSVDGGWQLHASIADVVRTIPEGLRELIEQQLARLEPAEQELLRAASVAGETFSVASIAPGLDAPAAEVEERCEALARRRQFLCAPDGPPAAGRYAFLHALYQKVLYDELSPARRARLHQRIGEADERRLGGRAAESAAELASHFAASGDHARALRYLAIAGESALARFANRDAIAFFENALELSPEIQDSPERRDLERRLLVGLGVAIIATRGFGAPEVKEVYSRAEELCDENDDPRRIFPILRGLYTFHLTRGALDEAQAIAERLDVLARRTKDPDLVLQSRFALGFALVYGGEIGAGTAHLERVADDSPSTRRATENLLYGQDAGVFCGAQAAWGLWVLDQPDRALRRGEQALKTARRLGSPHDVALAAFYLATTHLFRGELVPAERLATEALEISDENAFRYWCSAAAMCRGAAVALGGHTKEGTRELEEGYAGWDALGTRTGATHWVGRLAEAFLKKGDTKRASAHLKTAFALVEAHGEHWWEAELHRLRGEIELSKGARPAAERSFRRAIETARRFGALALERRAERSLEALAKPRGARRSA